MRSVFQAAEAKEPGRTRGAQIQRSIGEAAEGAGGLTGLVCLSTQARMGTRSSLALQQSRRGTSGCRTHPGSQAKKTQIGKELSETRRERRGAMQGLGPTVTSYQGSHR